MNQKISTPMRHWLKEWAFLLALLLISIPIIILAQSESPVAEKGTIGIIHFVIGGFAILALLILISLIYFIKKGTMPEWLKGGTISGLIFVMVLLLFGFLNTISSGGKCAFGHSSSLSIMNCFFVPIVIGIYGIIPILIIGLIIGLIIKKIKSEKSTL